VIIDDEKEVGQGAGLQREREGKKRWDGILLSFPTIEQDTELRVRPHSMTKKSLASAGCCAKIYHSAASLEGGKDNPERHVSVFEMRACFQR